MSGQFAAELIVSLANLQTKLQKRMSSVLSAHGISFSEFLVLQQLQLAPADGMRRIDLAERVGLSASGITRLLNPMQKTGLVRKEVNARDARVSLVAITKAGKRIFCEADETFKHTSTTLLAAVDDRQQKQLTGLVKALL